MVMKKIMFLNLSLFLGLTLIVTAAMSWGPGLGRTPDMKEEFGCPDLPILGEKQFHKVEAFQEPFLKEIEPLQNDLLAKMTELRILRLSPDSDPAAVEVKEKEIRDLQKKVGEKAAHHRGEIWKILNPEQRAQFDAPEPSIGFNPRKDRVSTSG
jgi:Spy/CpxP family protein refolding chaperone